MMVSTTTAATTTANAASTSASSTISADVADKVKKTLAPAAAGAQKITAALTSGQARLSSLGQLKSAIADFSALTAKLSAPAGSGADASASTDSARLQSFVDGYNALHSKLQTLQKGELKGDAGLNQVSTQLAQMLGPNSSGTAALAKAGVTIDASGAMKLDSAKLASSLAGDSTTVSKLLAPDGRGIVDLVGSRMGTLNTTNGTVGREASTATRQVEVLATKQAALTKTLTTQASALAAFYTQQANNSNGSGAPGSLFDMLA